MTVSAIIAAAKHKSTQVVPPGAVRDLKAFLAHNDASPRNKRVTADVVMSHLAAEYKMVMGRSTFDKLVKRVLGRGWGV